MDAGGDVPVTLLFIIASVAGFVGAMSGMGGGVVLIPVLTSLGVNIKHAIALSAVSVIATSSGAAAAYVRAHLANLKIGMFLEAFTMLGAITGAALTISSSPRWLYLAFALVLLSSFVTLLLQPATRNSGERRPDVLTRWLELTGSYDDHASGARVSYVPARAGLAATAMFGVGVLAGLLGIGAGALKVLVHDLIMGLPPKVSTTTSNVIIGVTALAGSSMYLAAGLLVPGMAAPTIVGVVLGSFVGTRVLLHISNAAVRRAFLVLLLVLGLEVLLRGARGHG